MKKYVVYNTTTSRDNNAGSKAGRDACIIAQRLGYEFVRLYAASGNHTTISNVIAGWIHMLKLCLKLKTGDIVFLQYPVNRYLMSTMYKMLKYKKAHIITLIHDIDFLRNVPLKDLGVEGMRKLECNLLSQSEYLICHNEKMIEELKKSGLNAKYISLGIFDYLYDGEDAQQTNDGSVIVAGNLLEQKAGYLYKIKDQKFKLRLYGSNLGKNFHNDQAEYHGSYTPEELIKNLRGDFGLVWDGPEATTCAGDYGRYLQLNNPHKASLYIAAGVPVVIWKKAALYPLIREYGIGFGVERLTDIDCEAQKHDYEQMKKNMSGIQAKIRKGAFLTEALRAAEMEIEQTESGK